MGTGERQAGRERTGGAEKDKGGKRGERASCAWGTLLRGAHVAWLTVDRPLVTGDGWHSLLGGPGWLLPWQEPTTPTTHVCIEHRDIHIHLKISVFKGKKNVLV